MSTKASEKIRERIAELEAVHSYGNFRAEIDQLTWALELVEAQWTAFADKMPPAPTSNDDVLLVRFRKEYRHRGYYIEAMQRHVDGGHWVNHGLQDLTVEDYMSHDAHAEWRLITPPEAP